MGRRRPPSPGGVAWIRDPTLAPNSLPEIASVKDDGNDPHARSSHHHEGSVLTGHEEPRYVFELYVAGDAPRSQVAIRSLEALCARHLRGRYRLTVVDVLKDPERAEQAKILATPTLLKTSPAPVARIVGDLTLTATVLAGLGLDGPAATAGPEEPRHE